MLVPCPECGKQVSDQAIRCPNCGLELAEDRLERARQRAKPMHIPTGVGILIFVVFVIGALGIGFLLTNARGPSSVPQPAEPVASSSSAAPDISDIWKPKLKLRAADWNWSNQYGFAIVEGRVKNVSDESLNGVEAVAEFSAADGSFVSSGSSMIDYQPVLPGQSSPFKIMATRNPAMGKASVSFKFLMGGTIAVDRSDPGPSKPSPKPHRKRGIKPRRKRAVPASKSEAELLQETTTYVAEPGDTLANIAKKFNTTEEALMRRNRFPPGTVAEPGLVISIPLG